MSGDNQGSDGFVFPARISFVKVHSIADIRLAVFLPHILEDKGGVAAETYLLRGIETSYNGMILLRIIVFAAFMCVTSDKEH